MTEAHRDRPRANPWTQLRLTVRLGLRNLARNKRRSSVMLVALGLFVGVCLALEGIAAGFYGSMTDIAVGRTLGEIQIHAPDHLPARDPDHVLDGRAVSGAELAALEGVRVVAPRVRVPGLVSHGGDARGVDAIGVTTAEAQFGRTPTRIADGRFVADDDGDVAVIGRGLASTLHVDVGGTIALQVGSGTPRPLTVVGVFESGDRRSDARLAYLPIATMRAALGLRPDDITEIALRTEPGADLDDVAARVRDAYASHPVQVQTWRELQPALAASMTTDHNFLRGTFAVLVAVAGIMVLNLQMMSVYERTRELGMMLAIGAKARRLAGMLAVEALGLGTLGVGIGFAIGLSILAGLSGGIDVLALTGGESNFGGFQLAPRVDPHLDPTVAVGMGIGALVVTVAAAIIPAARLFHLDPVTALRSGGQP